MYVVAKLIAFEC